jgi:hypothetical protein
MLTTSLNKPQINTQISSHIGSVTEMILKYQGQLIYTDMLSHNELEKNLYIPHATCSLLSDMGHQWNETSAGC